jgi:hypothetical protein
MEFRLFTIGLFFILLAAGQDKDFAYYQKLNNEEKRLADFKDSDSVLMVKLEQLELINASRLKFKVQTLELDILASRVANKQAKEAAENRYLSHWNMEGKLPFERYAEAGGKDHVIENAYSSWGNDLEDRKELTAAKELMAEGHGEFMAERYPNDGHKKAAIEPEHNFIGIGYFISGDYFAYYEEYIDRYLIEAKLEKHGEQYHVEFTIPEGYELYYFAIEYLKPGKKRTPQQLDRTGSYLDGGENDFMIKWPKDPTIKSYSLDFEPSKKGIYYVKARIKKSGARKSKEKEPFGASGWVVYKD